MVVPFAGAVVDRAYLYALDAELVSHDSVLLSIGLRSIATTVLLGILYPLMRKANLPTLHLAWSCTLAIAGLSAVVYFGAVLAGYGETAVEAGWVITAAGLPGLFLLLWFARQASRFSLPHAYFLVFVVGGVLPDFTDSLPFFFEWIWALLAGGLVVWLLTNFDLKGPWFRRWSVGIVAGLKLLVLMPLLVLASGDSSHLLLSLLVSVSVFLLPVALIHLVRVRSFEAKVLDEALSP